MWWHEWRGQAEPTMWIHHIYPKRFVRNTEGRRTGKLFIDVHKFAAKDDPDCFHTHPAYAIRIILWGGYVEELEDGRHRTWFPGMVGVITPAYSHRIAGLRNGRSSYSLWIRFRELGPVRLRGAGWKVDNGTPIEGI
jgi:hypothetical protein